MAWHNIKPNHSTALPARLVFLDTETIEEPTRNQPLVKSHYLRTGCLISGYYRNGKMNSRNVLHFDESRTFWHWLDCIGSQQYTTWVVAHKMSFDFGIVGGWEQLDTGRMVLDMPRAKRPVLDESESDPRLQRGLCVIDEPPFILGLRNKTGGRFVFVDTLNWFRVPLKDLGESIDLPKFDMPPNTATLKHWQIYCERDVEIIEKAFTGLIDFVRENDLGMFRYTAPSQAMSAFRHKHMKHKITLHDEAGVKKMERASYFGGDVRMFYSGHYEGELFQVDVNGMYPYVMKRYTYPVKLLDWNQDGQQSLTLPVSSGDYCIAEVDLDCRKVPNHIKDGKSNVYCLGRFRTTLAGPELRAAIERDDVLCVRNWACYDLAPIFVDYVDDFFALRHKYRADGNAVFELLCKLMLNSLYGKFGQQSYKWKQIECEEILAEWSTWPVHDLVNNRFLLRRAIGPYVFESSERGEHPQSFVAIAAYVTAYAREYMRWIRDICGEQQVFYQGSDSLVITPYALDKLDANGLLHPTQLGKMKIINSCSESWFRGPNNYQLGDDETIAGLKADAELLEPGKWSQTCFENAASQVHRRPTNTVRSWETIFTSRQRKYACGGGESGWLQPITMIDDSYTF